MARVLGYALTLGNFDGWADFRAVAVVRLSASERAAQAYALLTSLEPDQAETVAAVALRAADAPLPAFLGGMEDARLWASCASGSELKAYLLACFEALASADQAAFLRHVGARAAA